MCVHISHLLSHSYSKSYSHSLTRNDGRSQCSSICSYTCCTGTTGDRCGGGGDHFDLVLSTEKLVAHVYLYLPSIHVDRST